MDCKDVGKRNGQVTDQLQALLAVSADLNKQMDDLAVRLEPVLREPTPRVEEMSIPLENLVALASRISCATMDLERLQTRIAHILDRLEL